MRTLKAMVLSLVLSASVLAAVNTGLITLTSFPSAAVADGHSIINVDARVCDTAGRPVPDGTRVEFQSNLGSFQNPIVATQNGVAHGRFVAGSIAGMVKITATAIAYGANADITFELVADRSLLSSAKDYIEVEGDKSASYSYEQRITSASGDKRGARLRYKDVEIRADSLQVNADTYEVKAKNAVLRMGKAERTFGDLFYVLNKRTGYGTTSYQKPMDAMEPSGNFVKFVKSDKKEDTYGIAEITGIDAESPENIVDPAVFRFDDLATTTTEVRAKRVTAFPNKKVLFVGATVYVSNARVMRVPYYELDLVGQPHFISDTVFNVSNNNIALNYPYYLSLKPGQSSLLRLQTGASNDFGTASDRSVRLSYEYNWDRGDDMQGGFALDSIGRSDWGPRLTQYWRFNNGGSVSVLAEAPGHKSLYGSFNVAEPLRGSELTFDASAGHGFFGTPFDSQNYNLTWERDPFHIGNLPANFYVGLEAFSNSTSSIGLFADPSNPLAALLEQRVNTSQTAYGPRFRGQSMPLNLGANTSVNASFSMAKLDGHNALTGLTYDGSLSLARTFGPNFSTNITYEYTEDGFNSALLGHQQLSLQSAFHHGNARFDFFGIQGLDADRASYQAEVSYQLSKLWRIGYGYQQDRYLGANYSDFDIVLGFRVGYKEFGLVWSQKLHRIGFQLLGTTFN